MSPSSSELGYLSDLAHSCTQVFGAVAVLNLSVMSGNVAGVCRFVIIAATLVLNVYRQRTKQVVASSLVFMCVSLRIYHSITLF